MKTDWNLIREVMNATIGGCEHMERIGSAAARR
jgi:hypothetical protein